MSPHLPPTPSMSGELIIKDQQNEMHESSFALPPAALSPAARKDSMVSYCPVSPTSPDLAAMGRTASNPPRHAGTKRALDEFDLPPPPTRTRKIIQMKPKTQQSPPKPAASSTAKQKETAKTPANTASQTNSKKKQPSATSAAGRKIARKTAHSLIERRRRSKMNEEFNTLKNMIPACKGQEMHKLAILQVIHLELMIRELPLTDNRPVLITSGILSNASQTSRLPQGEARPSSLRGRLRRRRPSSSRVRKSPASVWQPRRRPHPSCFPPAHRALSSRPRFLPEIPGFHSDNPVWNFQQPFSQARRWGRPGRRTTPGRPRLSQRQHQHQHLQPSSRSSGIASHSYSADADIDHEASAALLMLNRDRRAVQSNASSESSDVVQDKQKKVGMSVRDLLVS